MTGRQFKYAMTYLLAAQHKMEENRSQFVRVARWLLWEFPSDGVRERIDRQVLLKMGKAFLEMDSLHNQPGYKFMDFRRLAKYAPIYALFGKMFGIGPEMLLLIPKVKILRFFDVFKRWVHSGDTLAFRDEFQTQARELGIKIPLVPLTVAQVEAGLNIGLKYFVYYMWWELIRIAADPTTMAFIDSAKYFIVTTPRERSEDELKTFLHGDKIREIRERMINDAIRGYRISQGREPPKEYIETQYSLWGNLDIDDVAVFMTPEDIEIFKSWTIHRTQFRWKILVERFPQKAAIEQIRERFATEQNPENDYQKARFQQDFEYWPLEEAKTILADDDYRVLESWRTYRDDLLKKK
jgi:hypothetical protein